MSQFWANTRNRLIYLERSGFNPHSVPGLAEWHDASDASTITLDGSNNSSEWRDKSGNGRHRTQSNVNWRPAYVTNVQNGLPGLLFDATDDAMTGYGNTTNPVNFFFVHRWSGSNRDTRLCSNTAVNGLALGISASSSWNMSFVREGVAWVPSGWAQGTSTRIYRVRFASGDASFWTYSGGTATLRQTTATTGTIGAGSPVIVDIPGHHFERVTYHGDPTSDQVTGLLTYLASKWAVA